MSKQIILMKKNIYYCNGKDIERSSNNFANYNASE